MQRKLKETPLTSVSSFAELGPIFSKKIPERKFQLNTTLLPWSQNSRKRLSKFSLIKPESLNSHTLSKRYSESELDNTKKAYLYNTMTLLLKTLRCLVKETNLLVECLQEELELVRTQALCKLVECLPAILNCKTPLMTAQETNQNLKSNILPRSLKKRSVYTCSFVLNAEANKEEKALQSRLKSKFTNYVRPVQMIDKEGTNKTHKITKKLSTHGYKNTIMLSTYLKSEIENDSDNVHVGTKFRKKGDIHRTECVEEKIDKKLCICKVNQKFRLHNLFMIYITENKYLYFGFNKISRYRQKFKEIEIKFQQHSFREFTKTPLFYIVNKFDLTFLQFFKQTIYNVANDKSVAFYKNKHEYSRNELKHYKSLNQQLKKSYFVGCVLMALDCTSCMWRCTQRAPFSFKCDRKRNILKCVDGKYNLQLKYHIRKQLSSHNNIVNDKAKGDVCTSQVREAGCCSSSGNENKGHITIRPEDSCESIETSSTASSTSCNTTDSNDSRASKKREKEKKKQEKREAKARKKKEKDEKKEKKKREKRKKACKKKAKKEAKKASKEAKKAKKARKVKKKKIKKDKKSKKAKKKNKSDDIAAIECSVQTSQTSSSQMKAYESCLKSCECRKRKAVENQPKSEGVLKMSPYSSGIKLNEPKKQERKRESDGFFSKCLTKIKSTFNICNTPGAQSSQADCSKRTSKTDTVIGKFRVVANYETGKLDVDVDKKSRKQLMQVLDRYAAEYDKRAK